MQYDFNTIEKKWQTQWENSQLYRAENDSEKPKFYVLDMFPYPSGAGLHVGHPLGYIASDIYSRYKRHKGFNVLHPMGYDSFGLPAEQYAIQTGQHPAVTTKVNIEGGTDKAGKKIAGYEKQLKKIGLSFDWSREVRTSDPSYYRWTQWIFTQLFEHYYDTDADKAMPISDLITVFEKNGNTAIPAICDEDTAVFTADQWNAFTEKTKEEILLQYRLTFLAEAEVNWCAELGTVLANDEVVNGVSERGGYPVVRKKMTQWMMRISAYSERLLQGLNDIDWPSALKEAQKNWIGKSKGSSVFFALENNTDQKIEVFTTRPDTLYGVTYMTLAPEHSLVAQITTAEQKEAVEKYVLETSKRSERDRMADAKSITGCFTGAYAVHPLTGKSIPIWIGDYVLAGYGTGAVMAVPCGDERDYAFAKHFELEITNIFDQDISEAAFTEKGNFTLVNSDFLNGKGYTDAMTEVIAHLEKKNIGKGKINYRLRDAVFSRQRYWGEPVPAYFDNGTPKIIAKEHLPLILPEVDEYLPTKDGQPPLGRATQWAWDTTQNKVVENDKIDQKTIFPIELNTMPGWAGSSWYFNRYMDAHNGEEFASKKALEYWQDVDLYLGGSEHATGHLLYSRFWQHFLYDLGLVPVKEYAKKLINQGMILGHSAFAHRVDGTNTFVSLGLKDQYKTTPIHVDVTHLEGSTDELNTEKFKAWREDFKAAEFVLEDGKFITQREVEKMSKSKYNVLNPDLICEEYGADTLRMYEMFLGPIEQSKPWNTQGLSGVHGFLKKYWRLFFTEDTFEITDEKATPAEQKVLHQTIKKVEEDILAFSFNTSISAFMIAANELAKLKCNKREILEPLTVVLAPFAPHITDEIWSQLGHTDSVHEQAFPVWEEKWLKESEKEYPISFNGKMRFKLSIAADATKEEIEEIVKNHERTIKQLDGKTPKKWIIIPGKIINIVV